MRHTDLFYVLALQNAKGVGDVTARRLISHFASAEAVFNASARQIKAVGGIREGQIESLRDKSVFEKAENELRFIESSGISVRLMSDADYPENLRHCPDAPLMLFSSGNIDLSGRKIISVVGTRKVTAYGAEFCRKLISDLSPLDPVIVSGFAYGVDIVAHQAAMENGLQTIGVLAHGLNQYYPKAHSKYAEAMKANGGFFTEFPSTSNPEPENFVRRNRIVAGLGEATVIIESADKGGSLITANIANDYNREVFAVPGRATDVYSEGCNRLIRTQRAHLLSGAADLVYMLGWELNPKPRPVQPKLVVPMTDEEQKIYDFLAASSENESLDEIALGCGFPVFRASSVLLNMELKGVVRPLPGKRFQAV